MISKNDLPDASTRYKMLSEEVLGIGARFLVENTNPRSLYRIGSAAKWNVEIYYN